MEFWGGFGCGIIFIVALEGAIIWLMETYR